MKLKRFSFILFAGLLALVLTGCGGGGNSAAWPGITVVDETIYLADGLHVYAVSLADGKELTTGSTPMRFPVQSAAQIFFFAPPVLAPNGQLIIGSAGHSHALYGVDPKTFAEQWKFNDAKDIYVGSSLVANERIYAPNGDGNLYVLDLNGNLLATFATEHGIWSQPVTDGKAIYITSLDHKVYALNLEGTSALWVTELDGSIISSPAVDAKQQVLYVGTTNKTIYALNANTGAILWQQSLDGAVWGAPVVGDGTVFVATTIVKEKGKVYALAAASGDTVWGFDTEGAVAGAPLLRSDAVVVATELGAVYAIRIDGTQLWKQNFEHNFYFGPVAAGNVILLAPSQSPIFLFAIDENGAQKWTFTPGK
jgi:outer membrane protein assembly factor BamB